MIEIRQDGDAVLLPVKVVPGASRTRAMGELGGRLKVAVAAPPEGGKANKALIAHLAELLGARKNDVSIHTGRTSAEKIVRIGQTTVAQAGSALGLTQD
jgi:uncharacterized protein (TIGR00251 family)